jgi:hypothetical protein
MKNSPWVHAFDALSVELMRAASERAAGDGDCLGALNAASAAACCSANEAMGLRCEVQNKAGHKEAMSSGVIFWEV